MPPDGRGMKLKLSKAINVHSSFLSQVISGKKELSQEQGILTCSFLGLKDLESDYFMTLLNFSKAGSLKLKEYYEKKLNDIKKETRDLKNIIESERELTQIEKSQYYSNWKYGAIRLLSMIPELKNANQIFEYTLLPEDEFQKAFDFLLKCKLIENENGELKVSAKKIHLGKDSEFLANHHINWRQKSLEKINNHNFRKDFFYTCPLVISKKDYEKLKEKFSYVVKDLLDSIKGSKEEELCCINIDFFRAF